MTLSTSLDLYTPTDLYQVMFDPRQTVSTSGWRNFMGARQVFSDQEYIRFDQVNASRKLAPFALPNAPGRPIYRGDGEEIRAFKPAYIKPKDAVTPGEFLSMTGPEVSGRVPLQTPAGRMAQKVIAITQFHRQAIERTWDWMFAKCLIDAQIDIRYQGDDGLTGQTVTVAYGRDAANTVDNSGTPWATATTDIFAQIQSAVDIVGAAEFGGPVTDLLMGPTAANSFLTFFNRSSTGTARGRGSGSGLDMLDRSFAGAESVLVNRGIVRTDPLNPFTFLGRLAPDLQCWKVSGMGNQFQNDDGTMTQILGNNEVIFVSPAVEMVQAYGAILDVNEFRAQNIFVKMWDEQDPSARFIMSQSAPLPIVVNPNATLKMTVG